MKEWGTFRGWRRGVGCWINIRGGLFGDGELPGLGDVCLADRALEWKKIRQERWGVEETYEFLAVDQPGVDLVEMKDMMAWQLADTITLCKFGEADCAFDLCLAPWYWVMRS